MRYLILILLFVPGLVYSQVDFILNEYQLVQFRKIIIRTYDSHSDADSLIEHRKKFHLVTTNSAVNDGVSDLINEKLVKSKFKAVALNSESRIVRRSNLSFAIYQSDELKSNVILREFDSGGGCDSCQLSIFRSLIEDDEVKRILNKKLKWIYTPYYQITLNGNLISSYLIIYYKEKGKRQTAISLGLD